MRRSHLVRVSCAVSSAAAILLTGVGGASASTDVITRPYESTAVETTKQAPPADVDARYPQITGERLLGLPDDPLCTVVMTRDYPMANTAYGPDEPFRGDFALPDDCAGPWNRIVARVSYHVTGVQFDRVGWVDVAGSRIVLLTSAEPRGEGAGQIVADEEYDVTRYASLFTDGAPVELNIANVVTGPYTGIFYTDLEFAFYGDDATPPADPVPDVVTGLPASVLNADPVDQTFRVPANTTELDAELYVKASGGCDEFWWASGPPPFQGQCHGYPVREIGVWIDGQPAAMVSVYPHLFTGANGPSWWHPIPAARTYNLRPYVVDLSPYIGRLTDGQRHTIELSLPKRDWAGGDNNLTVWTNLLVHRNPTSEGRTTGDLTAFVGDIDPTITDSGDVSQYFMTWYDTLEVEAWIRPAGGQRVVRATSFTVKANTSSTDIVDNHYSWKTSSRTGVDDASIDTLAARYRLVAGSASWLTTDYAHGSTVVDGRRIDRLRLRDRMHSMFDADAPELRSSRERWSLATVLEGCGTTRLRGENPLIMQHLETDHCRW